MALIERVTTLLRANVRDLLERAENPETTLRQLLVDMENQLLQVKTQVAIALADRHLLEKKALEQRGIAADWHRKAELAVREGEDMQARAALTRALTHETTLSACNAQIADQKAEAEALRTSYAQLEAKLLETRATCDRLIAQHRRARTLTNLAESRALRNGAAGIATQGKRTAGRIGEDLEAAESLAQEEAASLVWESANQRSAGRARADQVEQLLSELKEKQQNPMPTA